MSSPSTTRIGQGGQAIVLEKVESKWPALEVSFHRDDISRPTDWRIHERRHAVVVHLGGHMERLETELEGFGGSCRPAVSGEDLDCSRRRAHAPGSGAPPLSRHGPALSAQTVRLLREFISEQLSERITLDALARLAGMTKHHLLIAFRN